MNTSAEYPPKDENNEEVLVEQVETYTAPKEIDSHLASLRTKELEEKDSLVAEKKTEIDALIAKAIDSNPAGDEAFEDTRKPEEKQQAPEEVKPKKGFLKKWMMTLGFLGAVATGSAKSTSIEKGGDDSTKTNKTERTISAQKDGVNFQGARKVDKITADYTLINKGNKTYGVKTTAGKEGTLKKAKPSDNIEGGEKYEEWLIEQLKTGTTTAQELADNNYISQDNVKKYDKYYVAPSTDVVYMEGIQETKTDPFAAFAKDGEALYAPNGHIAAEMFYPVRSSDAITDGGMLNTQHSDVLLRFRNDFGFIDASVIIPADKIGDIFGGSNTFLSNTKMEELKAQALASNNKIYDMSSQDIASK